MRVRRRVDDLERRIRGRAGVFVPVFWDGRDEDAVRERVDEARRLGHSIRVIRLGLMDEADTVKEAEAKVTTYREAGDMMPLTVYRRGPRGNEILAEWEPDGPGASNARRPDVDIAGDSASNRIAAGIAPHPACVWEGMEARSVHAGDCGE